MVSSVTLSFNFGGLCRWIQNRHFLVLPREKKVLLWYGVGVL